MSAKVLCIAFLLVAGLVEAQQMKQPFFNVSYFGVLGTHPGIKISVQCPLATLNQSEIAVSQFITAPSLLLYFHRRNQIGLGFNLELGYRNREIDRTNLELMLGLGYLRTILPNRVYDFEPDGSYTKRSLLGQSHLLKSLSIGLGKNTGDQLDELFWMVKPTLFHLKPYNTRSTLNFAIDAGLYFK